VATAQADSLEVSTWNLGWHLDSAQAKAWIAACSRPFALQGETWQPVAQPGPGTLAGWQLPWGRNAPVAWDITAMPPCGVFQSDRQTLPADEASYAQRAARIGTLVRDRMRADVIAFQEVSGAQAVRELLGKGYEVCSFEGHKVQRLAIAWKTTLGAGHCDVHWPLALPELPAKDQVRPGLTLRLSLNGRRVSVMTVHLKSSCVSPIDDRAAEGRGQLDGDDSHCKVLQAQVAPLRAWLAAEARQADALVLLGDFNRNFAHEAREPADRPVRVNGRARNLWRELGDGSAALQLLPLQCDAAEDPSGLCGLGQGRLLAREEMGRLRGAGGLGCFYPLGLDHIVLAGSARAPGGAKAVPLGRLGISKPGDPPTLALSDHCPLSARIAF
jgi:endonuclease/exonuclease/phosphatase family metal-dependent hydrolase